MASSPGTQQQPRILGFRHAISIPRLRHKNTARRVVEQRLPDRPPPPARAERGLLLVPDHDKVALQLRRKAGDLFHRLADREVPGDGESFFLQLRDAFVQHLLSALLLFFEELLGQEAFGQEHARGHPGHREEVRFRFCELGDLGASEQGRLAFARAVVRQQDLVEHGSLLFALLYFASSPSRSIRARSFWKVSRAYFAYS